MNEVEMADALGLLVEPVANRVYADSVLKASIHELCATFEQVQKQKVQIGVLTPDASWVGLLPWHSLN
jgi:hypothetical protein